MTILFRTLVLGALAIAPPSLAQNYEQNHAALVDAVSLNPNTADAVWLEMLNAFNEWEGIILVFGFAGSGDWAQCERIRLIAFSSGAGSEYRCNPVN